MQKEVVKLKCKNRVMKKIVWILESPLYPNKVGGEQSFMLGQSILYFKFWERKPCPSQCTNVLLLLRFWSPKTHGTCGTEWERDLLGWGGVAKGSGLRVLQGTYWHLPSLLKSVSSPESWVDSTAEQGRVCRWDTTSERVCLLRAHTLPRSGQRLCPSEEGWE